MVSADDLLQHQLIDLNLKWVCGDLSPQKFNTLACTVVLV